MSIENISFEYSKRIIIDKSELIIDKLVKYPIRIEKDRYGFNLNHDLIDIKNNCKVFYQENYYGNHIYTLYDINGNIIYINKGKLLLYNYILPEDKASDPNLNIYITFIDGDNNNYNLDNMKFKYHRRNTSNKYPLRV